MFIDTKKDNLQKRTYEVLNEVNGCYILLPLII